MKPSRLIACATRARPLPGRYLGDAALSWKTAYRSFYYADAEQPDDIRLDPATTALLVIDVQNVYLAPKRPTRGRTLASPSWSACARSVIPNIARLIADCRKRGVEVIYARIACLQARRPRPLAQPEEAGLQLPADAQGPRGQPDRPGACAAAATRSSSPRPPTAR